MSTDQRSPRESGVVVVLSGFPRRSETFALPELAALEQAGLLMAAFATKPGDGLAPHPDAARLSPRVRVLKSGRIEDQASEIVEELGSRRPRAVHGYFAHHPAAVAACAAERLGVPYGFSAHAKDARTVPRPELGRRAAGARCVVVCNADAQVEIARLGVTPALIPHGVNLTRFAPSPLPADGELRVLAVGRLVPKKGFNVLLDAIARVRVPWTLCIVGDGPDGASLRSMADSLGIGPRVTWHGSASHADLPALYAAAHLVAVPSVVDEAGDRDGLPNVLLEALASERPVVATRAGAIESAIVDGETGLLVRAGDARALASAIETVAGRADLARAIARGGRQLVERRYDVTVCARRFTETLAAAYD
ncbi:MAG: glycosyltransferase [Vicinamibacterales bacterium]